MQVGALQSSFLVTFVQCDVCACVLVCLRASVLMCLCVIVRSRAVCGTQTAVQLIGGYVQVGALQSSSAESGQSVGDQLVPTKPLQPFHPLQGELTATTCAGPFQELVLASTGGTEEASNPSVLGEEGSDFEAHGELNLPL